MGKNILFHLDNQVQPWIVLWIFFSLSFLVSIMYYSETLVLSSKEVAWHNMENSFFTFFQSVLIRLHNTKIWIITGLAMTQKYASIIKT